MKIFKRLMSFALAMLTMMSVIPIGTTPARAAPSNAQMMDNYVMDSMVYLGFDMEGYKKSGLMYTKAWDGTGEEGVEYAPADIGMILLAMLPTEPKPPQMLPQ